MTAIRMLFLALQHLPESMLTYNLHILVCRLSKQETAKGCVAFCGELWVERNIHFVKSNVKYRITSCPEKLYVHDRMVDGALAAMRHVDSVNASVRTAVKSFDELVRYQWYQNTEQTSGQAPHTTLGTTPQARS